MEKMFDNKILDELYEIRGDRFVRVYINKYGKPEKSKKAEKAEVELVNFMKKYIKDENDMKELFEKINKFESYTLDEMCFFHKSYYKLGFIDGISLKNQIEEKITYNNCEESIIYQNINEITDYFEEKKYSNLKRNEEYKIVLKEIEKIKKKFPKVRSFLEDDEIAEFTQEEMKEILNIIGLYNDRAMYEENEMFKIGLSEGKAL